MRLSTEAWIGHPEGVGPCIEGAELDEFRALLERVKGAGSRVAVTANYAQVAPTGRLKDKPMPPFVFNCTRCLENATSIVDEVFGGHEPLPLQDWCGNEPDEAKDEGLRKLFRVLKGLGVAATFQIVGASMQVRIGGVVEDMAEFNCRRCLERIRLVVEGEFGVESLN